jgi:AraC family transcriptional regulator of adaptative response / DNA-3-methyladenine glycosylase II
MNLDADLCYQRLLSRDVRFDGAFFVGVSTTRIYCRPVCPVRTPRRDRCHFFATAAMAESAGFRPCLRCRPELAPGLAPMDAMARTAAQARARIEAGALDQRSLEDLASELRISSRQLRRAVEAAYGVTPVQLAQTQRLLLGKRLLTDTDLPVADIAFASGFGSVRRFNHLFRTRYRLSPLQLRRGVAAVDAGDDGIRLRLAYRPPLAWDALIGFLAGRGAAGVEAVDGRCYRRTVAWGDRRGWLQVEPDAGNTLRVTLSATLLPALAPLLSSLRALFDLDAAPAASAAFLSRDRRLAPSVEREPGLRVPGAFDGFELALRAVLGQQVSVRGATTLFGRFAARFGEPAAMPHPALHRHTPAAASVAEASVEQLAGLGLPRSRALTVRTLARAVADGRINLHPGAPVEATVAELCELPGIGDWTAQYVAMRALRDADAFPASDLVVKRALGVSRERDAIAIAEAWRPWRAYAVMHLWRLSAAGG